MTTLPYELGQRAWVHLCLENQPAFNTARLCRILRERVQSFRPCGYGERDLHDDLAAAEADYEAGRTVIWRSPAASALAGRLGSPSTLVGVKATDFEPFQYRGRKR